VTYIINTPEQQREMLQTIGVDSLSALFDQIPLDLRLERPLDLPGPLTEVELEGHLRQLAKKNLGATERGCFMGGGVYDHFIPAAVDEIVSRGEYYTAYTPYQAEASQGSLQAFFEYQTLICQLTGMDVSNASLYEGGTALSEAAFMAMRVTRRYEKIVILGTVHPEYRQVVETYCGNLATQVQRIPIVNGTVDLAEVEAAVDETTACLAFQHPNVFGCLEQPEQLTEIAHRKGALSVVSFDPISLGLLKRPGDYGVDIAVAEGQSLGIPLQFGGPFLGIMACTEACMRKMPGRLIGRTKDRNGKPCFVLNLQAREQHIRRDKATSNICTNQGLLALRATVYLALQGPAGLREAAELCCRKAHYAAEELAKLPGVKLLFDRPFFKEFAIRTHGKSLDLIEKAKQAGFDIGPVLSRFPFLRSEISGADDALLVAVTEKRTRQEIDSLVAALK
jgi:glycine dehydrogenase subunit 1